MYSIRMHKFIGEKNIYCDCSVCFATTKATETKTMKNIFNSYLQNMTYKLLISIYLFLDKPKPVKINKQTEQEREREKKITVKCDYSRGICCIAIKSLDVRL